MDQAYCAKYNLNVIYLKWDREAFCRSKARELRGLTQVFRGPCGCSVGDRFGGGVGWQGMLGRVEVMICSSWDPHALVRNVPIK